MAAYVYPDQFARCVELLTERLQAMATRAGIPDEECADLEGALAALPPFSRDRASVMLQGVRAQTSDACMAFAASYILHLAHEVWEDQPATIAAMAGPRSKGPQAVQ